MSGLLWYAAVGLLAGTVLVTVVGDRRRRRFRVRANALSERRSTSAPAVERRRAVRWFGTLPPRRRTSPRDPRLPLVAELLAACLAAGAVPAAGAAAVGSALDGPLAAALRRSARELRLGGDPAVAWRRLAEQPGAAPLARRLELADSTGIPAVAAIASAAADERAARARRARTAVRQAGVHITGPLGLCFLPAFLLLGVAPVVIGLAAPLF